MFIEFIQFIEINKLDVIFQNSLNGCYLTNFPQKMLYYKIPSAHVILQNSLNGCYFTKFPQRMLYYKIPSAEVISPGAHYEEPAISIISLCNGIFTDQSIFRYFSREIDHSSLLEHASVRIKQCGLMGTCRHVNISPCL